MKQGKKKNNSRILVCQVEDQNIKIGARPETDIIRLSRDQITQLFRQGKMDGKPSRKKYFLRKRIDKSAGGAKIRKRCTPNQAEGGAQASGAANR